MGGTMQMLGGRKNNKTGGQKAESSNQQKVKNKPEDKPSPNMRHDEMPATDFDGFDDDIPF